MKRYLVFFFLSLFVHLYFFQKIYPVPASQMPVVRISLELGEKKLVAPEEKKVPLAEPIEKRFVKPPEPVQETLERILQEPSSEENQETSEEGKNLQTSGESIQENSGSTGDGARKSPDVPSAFHIGSPEAMGKGGISGAPGKGNGASGDGSGSSGGERKQGKENVLEAYQKLVREKIESCKEYPLQARKLALEGTVEVRFVLTREGKVKEVEIVKSSGFLLLDNAGKRAVERAAPFPPFPPEIRESTLSFSLSFRFSLNE
ncbi:MAG: energy transducer TonB [bacterium]